MDYTGLELKPGTNGTAPQHYLGDVINQQITWINTQNKLCRIPTYLAVVPALLIRYHVDFQEDNSVTPLRAERLTCIHQAGTVELLRLRRGKFHFLRGQRWCCHRNFRFKFWHMAGQVSGLSLDVSRFQLGIFLLLIVLLQGLSASPASTRKDSVFLIAH